MLPRIGLAAIAIPAALYACGARQTDSGGFGDGIDAGDATRADDSSVELPDGLVLVDGDTSDAAADGARDAGTEAEPPPPGSCVGKPDGTVCVHAPNGCYADA